MRRKVNPLQEVHKYIFTVLAWKAVTSVAVGLDAEKV